MPPPNLIVNQHNLFPFVCPAHSQPRRYQALGTRKQSHTLLGTLKPSWVLESTAAGISDCHSPQWRACSIEHRKVKPRSLMQELCIGLSMSVGKPAVLLFAVYPSNCWLLPVSAKSPWVSPPSNASSVAPTHCE